MSVRDVAKIGVNLFGKSPVPAEAIHDIIRIVYIKSDFHLLVLNKLCIT